MKAHYDRYGMRRMRLPQPPQSPVWQARASSPNTLVRGYSPNSPNHTSKANSYHNAVSPSLLITPVDAGAYPPRDYLPGVRYTPHLHFGPGQSRGFADVYATPPHLQATMGALVHQTGPRPHAQGWLREGRTQSPFEGSPRSDRSAGGGGTRLLESTRIDGASSPFVGPQAVKFNAAWYPSTPYHAFAPAHLPSYVRPESGRLPVYIKGASGVAGPAHVAGDTTRRSTAQSPQKGYAGNLDFVKPFSIVNRETGAGGVTGVDGIWRDEEDVLHMG